MFFTTGVVVKEKYGHADDLFHLYEDGHNRFIYVRKNWYDVWQKAMNDFLYSHIRYCRSWKRKG